MSAYKLVKLAGGAHSLHALDYGETMHPALGPAAEADALYVRQLRLAERLRQTEEEFVVWDVGLGAAANALAVLRATEAIPRAIRLVSFDCTIAPLDFALQHSATLGYFAGYESRLPDLARAGRIVFQDRGRRVDWQLHVADFPTLLASPAAGALSSPHAVLFDAFSPARNPAMWTLPLFTNLFSRLDPQRACALSTYSRSTLLRVTLLLAGFYVGVGHATGQKEETTVAANALALIEEPLPPSWLQRARRSRSAEPLNAPVYRQAPLSDEAWEKLQRHPQFK